MPVNIENVTSDVTLINGDLPLSDAQIEQIVILVMRRLEAKQRADCRAQQATMLRSQAAPSAYGTDRGESCR